MGKKVYIGPDARGPIETGQATVGTSLVQLSGRSKLIKGVTVKAHPDNTDVMYVTTSPSGTASTAYPLSAGQEKFIPVDAVDKVYCIADSASQTACIIAY